MIIVLVLNLFCFFENSVTEKHIIVWLKDWNISMFTTHIICYQRLKKICKKILTQERKEKLGINQQNCSQTSGSGSLLNLVKVCITIKGIGSMKTNMEKSGIMTNDDNWQKLWCESEAESNNDSPVSHEIVYLYFFIILREVLYTF